MSRTLNVMHRKIQYNTSQETKQRNPCLLTGVTEWTARDYFKRDLDYRSCRPVPKLWATCAHHLRILAFATQYNDWDLDEWWNVLWSDEASFMVTDNEREGFIASTAVIPVTSTTQRACWNTQIHSWSWVAFLTMVLANQCSYQRIQNEPE